MVRAIWEAEVDYDRLLNKYYTILLHSLNLEDQEVLKTSQRNWLKFRDSEQNLSSMLSEEKYSRGTMQRIVHADNGHIACCGLFLYGSSDCPYVTIGDE